MAMSHSEYERELREWIQRRMEGFNHDAAEVNSISAKAGDEALKFVGLAHLGGIAGCLGFIGALKYVSVSLAWALALFIAGVLFLFIAHLARYLLLMSAGRFIHGQASAFSENPTPEKSKELVAAAKERERKFIDWSVISAVFSGLLFIAGVAFVVFGAMDLRAVRPAQELISDGYSPAPTRSSPTDTGNRSHQHAGQDAATGNASQP